MEAMRLDLHTHSTASDGALSPSLLIKEAARLGIGLLALTDHDTTSGLEEASRAAREEGISFIPGIEIEVAHEGGEFHLLGLGIDASHPVLGHLLADLRRRRHERNVRIIHRMREAGIEVSLEDMEEVQGVVTRPHFARLLVARGLARSIPEAMEEYLNYGRPFYEPKAGCTLEEAVRAIHTAGGLAVIAHPVSLGIPDEQLVRRFADYREAGVDGVEAYHYSHSLEEARKFSRIAASLGLLVSAGSDFHGKDRRDVDLGTTAGGLTITSSLIPDLIERLSHCGVCT
ncbi:PHP domain-containing protein [Spirochaeta thermophila]|nr:PHP domain-containing protein [Spirochaeta thermophila]